MERNANYIVVGMFTIISLLSLAAFAFWMGKYGGDEERYYSYKTYIGESVAGLKASSPVKLKGLDVGFVEEVAIDAGNPERVEVKFKIEKTAPIKSDSVIVLNSQGIAGIAYLEIKGGTKNSPPLSAIDSGERPVIPSELSMVSKLSDKAEIILTNLTQTISRIDKLASDKNIENIGTSLDNFALISTELKENRKEISTLIRGAKEMETNANDAIVRFSAVTQKAGSALDETKTLVRESSGFVQELRHSNTMERVSSTLDNSNDVMDEAKSLISEGKLLIRELRESPGNLLFRDQTLRPGPGE